MLLILIYSDDEKTSSKILEEVPHVEILRGVFVTWEQEEKVRRALERAKDKAISEWERRGEGPVLEFAVISLSDAQYNSIRHMVRRSLDGEAERVAAELRRLASDIRGRRRAVAELKARFSRLAREVSRLTTASAKLGLETSSLLDMLEAYKEANAEYLKLK